MTQAMDEFALGSGFAFSGATIEDLEASEYTLVTIAVDETGSVDGKEGEIRDMLIAAVEACKRSPYSQNLLVRVIRFGSQYSRQNGGGVDELHGFTPLSQLDTTSYPRLTPGGLTPLCDAVYSGVGAANAYAKSLADMDFATNGITFIVTDGGENASVATMDMVKQELAKSTKGEIMESHYSILIGIDVTSDEDDNDPHVQRMRQLIKQQLDEFKDQAGIDQFIWAGEATKGKLAKLAQFVSQSVSSTSQALGTGGPSQNISATI